LDSIRRIVHVLRLGSRQAEMKVGLSAAQLFVLQKLAESDDASVNELARRTHTHQSSVSVVAQRLVKRGLVARKRSPSDGRQAQLSVTAAGRNVLRSAPAAAQDRLIEALDGLSSSQRRQLALSMGALIGQLGIDGTAPAKMLFEEERSK
jgi:DNA-binding MarR family transcriptional regulator